MKVKKMKHKKNDRHPNAFKNYDDDNHIHQSMVIFLCRVWKDAPKDSFLFLATTYPDGSNWREHVVRARKVKGDLNRFLHKHSRWDYNLYFGVNPFSQSRRQKENALPTWLGWCDIDASDPSAYRPQPNLLWETSPDRFQGLWLWDKKHDVEDAERLSCSLADRHGGDSGWTVTKMLRIPGSVNHKPHYDEPFVRIVSQNWNRLSERPKLTADGRRRHRVVVQALDMNPFKHDRLKVLKKYRRSLNPWSRIIIGHESVRVPDRSKCIFAMVAGLHEAGADTDEIACMVWGSPYFQAKYGEDINALETEISRIISKLGGRNG